MGGCRALSVLFTASGNRVLAGWLAGWAKVYCPSTASVLALQDRTDSIQCMNRGEPRRGGEEGSSLCGQAEGRHKMPLCPYKRETRELTVAGCASGWCVCVWVWVDATRCTMHCTLFARAGLRAAGCRQAGRQAGRCSFRLQAAGGGGGRPGAKLRDDAGPLGVRPEGRESVSGGGCHLARLGFCFLLRFSQPASRGAAVRYKSSARPSICRARPETVEALERGVLARYDAYCRGKRGPINPSFFSLSRLLLAGWVDPASVRECNRMFLPPSAPFDRPAPSQASTQPTAQPHNEQL